MAEVGVVIPAYNPGGKLERAIESVLQQSHPDWDLVVVDDGGKEDLAWVAEIDDPRIRLLRQRNGGVSVARNVGVSATGAPYIAFLDQDDEWLPGKLAHQMAAVRERRAGFSFTEFFWVSADGEWASEPEDVSYTTLLGARQHICLSTAVVSREAYERVGGHDPLLSQMQDYDLFLKLLLVDEPTAHVAEHHVRYTLHESNASRDYETALAEARAILASHRRRAVRRDDPGALQACRAGTRARRELFGAKAYDAARAELGERHLTGIEHLGRAFRLSPGPTLRALGKKAATTTRRAVGQ